MALKWAVLYPDTVESVILIATNYRRWCLAFGDLLDAESPLRVELRRYESA